MNEEVKQQIETDARLFVAFWNYKAFEDAQDLILETKERILTKGYDLEKVVYYDKLSNVNELVDFYISSLFSLQYYQDEKVAYFFSTLDDVKMLKTSVEPKESLTYEERVMLDIALHENELIKKIEEEDIQKLVNIVEQKGVMGACQIEVLDGIKRQRFGVKKDYLDFIRHVNEVSERITASIKGDDYFEFINDFFAKYLKHDYYKMLENVYERQADRIFS
ncbi:hypothetical protein D6777_04115 [Candidatus Woesearchaeota archaeon]|nr:MAG: hypothetical protein D6777_04115 [Candidatus Woesearchaeota archaeon]